MKKKNLTLVIIFMATMLLPIGVSAKTMTDSNSNNMFSFNTVPINTLSTATADEIKEQYIGNTTCGGLNSFTFHERIPKLTSTLYNLLKFAIPVLLVIKGMLDMFKATTAGKEDEMKKAQKKFINRLIAAISAFIVLILVETIIGWIASRTDDTNAMDCVNCFINNEGCTKGSSGNNYNDNMDNNSNNNNDDCPNCACPNGYTKVNKICIKFTKYTSSTGYVPKRSCPSGYTITNEITGHCIKVESAKSNGNPVINAKSLSCSSASDCKLGNYSFKIGTVVYIEANKCENNYKEVVDKNTNPNNYYCVK